METMERDDDHPEQLWWDLDWYRTIKGLMQPSSFIEEWLSCSTEELLEAIIL